ncbi:MAG: hypothetical protein ACLPVW_17145 [Terriglobales bacterium]
MPSFRELLQNLLVSSLFFAALCISSSFTRIAAAQTAVAPEAESPAPSAEPQARNVQGQDAQPRESQSQNDESPQPRSRDSGAPLSNYDKSVFQKPVPGSQFAFLNRFAGAPANDLIRDKQYRKLMGSVIPDCIFHYGWDIILKDALEKVLAGSTIPVQIRDARYVMVSGRSGPYLAGRGFMWIDMQDGIALGGFYFHPTNGEPTPTVTIFSRQVKQRSFKMSQLPPAFAEDLKQWSADSGVPPVTTRYFIGGSNLKLLLEHDEDYCASLRGTSAATDDCEQMNADAADIDLNAAYYLDQTNYATNGTAWMIASPEQTSWIQLRDETCRLRPDRLLCRIRMTRERIRVVIQHHPVPKQSPPHK